MSKEFDVKATVQELESGHVPGWIQDHLRRYLESNGKDGHYFDASAVGATGLVPSLLLTTIGRKSGKRTTMPLFYGETDSGYVVIGSKGGSDTHPAWHLNLLSDPSAEVQVGEHHYAVRARVASGEERSRLWEQMVAVYPPYTNYQRATSREIPVIVLERV